jgi:SAM-dependent methyltransferase
MSLYGEHAELYDIAFDWDVSDEVDWLLDRLGSRGPLLEPGCGTGRMLEAFARRGVEIVGFDVSPGMVEFARRRLADAGVRAEVLAADMTDFDLGRRFAGAICPINTLGHLDPARLARHFELVARHLEPGARYLVQVGLVRLEDELGGSYWDADRGETSLRIAWEGVSRDWESGREEARSRIEILTGPRRGEVVEERHMMTVWSPDAWIRATESSPFDLAATYDGNVRDRPRVEPSQGGGLLWHELVRQ